ncbi:MAG: hypothetical protein ABS82_00195 [Rhodanobacter sp. SCN 67-45]|nr:MAG: hypothetical protein ABS82_00195 [Rhodanobacter sp. SCN 67-45]
MAKFVKGQSGNPGGRPKLTGHVQELARAHTDDAIKTLAAIMLDKKANATSRATAAQALLDRGWGKPAQQLKHVGANGGPIQNITATIDPVEAARIYMETMKGGN